MYNLPMLLQPFSNEQFVGGGGGGGRGMLLLCLVLCKSVYLFVYSSYLDIHYYTPTACCYATGTSETHLSRHSHIDTFSKLIFIYCFHFRTFLEKIVLTQERLCVSHIDGNKIFALHLFSATKSINNTGSF